MDLFICHHEKPKESFSTLREVGLNALREAAKVTGSKLSPQIYLGANYHDSCRLKLL